MVFDPRTGFCPETKTFHSIRRPVPLSLPSVPLSYPSYARAILPSTLPSQPALVDAATGAAISYPDLFSLANSLAASLRSLPTPLSLGHVAFIISPNSIHIPVLYFALLSLGVVVNPANPAATSGELSRFLRLTNPAIAFATSSTATKLPPDLPTILLDSPLFQSFLTADNKSPPAPSVRQSDVASIQFSSGTTGRTKAAALSHGSFIAMTAGFHALRQGAPPPPEVTMMTAPMFHSMGFYFTIKSLALGETLVVLDRATIPEMLRAAERFRVTQMTAAPPVVVALAKSEEALKYDLSALARVFSGGAAMPADAAKRFCSRFPRVLLIEGYGSTEAGGISRMIDAEECRRQRSAGRITENIQAKIVDPVSGEPLSVGQQGELWVKSPAAMIGYVGDEEANAMTFDAEGWLKTGDLCYIDEDGFLYVVDRLKELIKYKAYQVPPAELEQVLHSLPEITDAAVVPYPNEEVGQIPMAFVVRQPGSKISEVEVINYVAKQVAPYKKIRKVAFVNSIPKSAAGKVLRKELAIHALSPPVSRL